MSATNPVSFSCEAILPVSAAEIVEQIMNVANWPDFSGYGPIPGIHSANIEIRSETHKGTRIRVVNRDGSTHVEEIIAYDPDRQLLLKMHEFSAPVHYLATHFLERWDFTPQPNGTRVVRTLELYPKSVFARPILWMLSRLLKRAIAKHLEQMQQRPKH